MSGDHNYRKDLHAVLGVDEKAGPDELRRAYLALAVKYHPDRNPGDTVAEERFKDISQAYAILSDPAARARYERLRPRKGTGTETGPASGSARSEGSGAGTRSGSSARPGEGAGAGEVDFEEILAAFFKSAKGRAVLDDLEKELNRVGLKFTLEDFSRWFKNHRSAVRVKKPFLERLADWLPGARDRARKKAGLHEIHYRLSLTPQAASAGTTVEITYLRDTASHHLKVKIPAGAQNGSRLRLVGQGRQKPDGTRGDLLLTILVTRA